MFILLASPLMADLTIDTPGTPTSVYCSTYENIWGWDYDCSPYAVDQGMERVNGCRFGTGPDLGSSWYMIPFDFHSWLSGYELEIECQSSAYGYHTVFMKQKSAKRLDLAISAGGPPYWFSVQSALQGSGLPIGLVSSGTVTNENPLLIRDDGWPQSPNTIGFFTQVLTSEPVPGQNAYAGTLLLLNPCIIVAHIIQSGQGCADQAAGLRLQYEIAPGEVAGWQVRSLSITGSGSAWQSMLGYELPLVEWRHSSWSEPAQVMVTPTTNGHVVSGPESYGEYQLSAKPRRHLRRTITVTVDGGTPDPLELSFLAGDIDGDNVVTVFDAYYVSLYWDKDGDDPDWLIPDSMGIAPTDADLDMDEAITVYDYNILSGNFDAVGDE